MNPQVHTNPNGMVRPLPVFRNNSNNSNQYQTRNGGPQAYRGAHAPTQVQQQQRYVYQNNPINMVNQRPLVGSQSQSKSPVEFFPNNGVHQRNLNNGMNQRPPGQSSQNQQAPQRWKPRPEK